MPRLFYLPIHRLQTLISACRPRNYRALWSVAILIAIFIANPVLAANLDYGDAPTDLTAIDAALTSTYASASHQIGNDTYLGAIVDAEEGNQPTLGADGDDNKGTPNDEDGVIFPKVLAPTLPFLLLVSQIPSPSKHPKQAISTLGLTGIKMVIGSMLTSKLLKM